MDTKVKRAAEIYFTKKGYGIIGIGEEVNLPQNIIVAKDPESDELVFIQVFVKDVNQTFDEAENSASRAIAEEAALKYFANSSINDVAIRFDVFTVIIFDNDRAFLRHHTNALGVDD